MDATLPNDQLTAINLDSVDRWTVFSRLQELSVPCECTCGHPLKVTADSPTAVLQIWSVVRNATHSRAALVETLESCWNMAVTA